MTAAAVDRPIWNIFWSFMFVPNSGFCFCFECQLGRQGGWVLDGKPIIPQIFFPSEKKSRLTDVLAFPAVTHCIQAQQCCTKWLIVNFKSRSLLFTNVQNITAIYKHIHLIQTNLKVSKLLKNTSVQTQSYKNAKLNITWLKIKTVHNTHFTLYWKQYFIWRTPFVNLISTSWNVVNSISES
jgi:hypothetical protein